MREEIKTGDWVIYKPTGHYFQIKEIWADSCFGEFKLQGGKLKEARAVMSFVGDSGHYPYGDDIEKLPDGKCQKCNRKLN